MTTHYESSSSSSGAQTKRPNLTPAFLEKLFDILEENSPYRDLIAWQPDGHSFIIKKPNEFSEIVLPKYFKHSNLQSYIRQLNMYGFSKTRHDSAHREFAHKLFQRGRRDLLPLIKRKAAQSASTKALETVIFKTDEVEDPEDPLKSSQTLAERSQEEQRAANGSRCDGCVVIESRLRWMESQLVELQRQFQELASRHNSLCDLLNGKQPITKACTYQKPDENNLNLAQLLLQRTSVELTRGWSHDGVIASETNNDRTERVNKRGRNLDVAELRVKMEGAKLASEDVVGLSAITLAADMLDEYSDRIVVMDVTEKESEAHEGGQDQLIAEVKILVNEPALT